jgi:hypothetical protein
MAMRIVQYPCTFLHKLYDKGVTKLRELSLVKVIVTTAVMVSLVAWILSMFSSPEQPNSKYNRKNKYNIPLPEECHATVTEQEIAGRPVFVVGDVHGCYDELCQLLRLAADHRENPYVVFVGDMINKGPKSIDVLK